MVPFLIGLAVSAVSIGALFLLGALKWIESSSPDPCVKTDTCYCERLRLGMIKQPSNTWSNLGFVLVGLTCSRACRRWSRARVGIRWRSERFTPFSTAAW